MPKANDHPTIFDNHSIGQLTDEYGALDAEIKVLTARKGEARSELLVRGIETTQGDRFSVSKSEAERWTLDTKAVQAEMGEAWCNQRSRISHVISLRVKALPVLAVAAE